MNYLDFKEMHLLSKELKHNKEVNLLSTLDSYQKCFFRYTKEGCRTVLKTKFPTDSSDFSKKKHTLCRKDTSYSNGVKSEFFSE